MYPKNYLRTGFMLILLIPMGVLSQFLLCLYILKFNKLILKKIDTKLDDHVKNHIEDNKFIDY